MIDPKSIDPVADLIKQFADIQAARDKEVRDALAHGDPEAERRNAFLSVVKATSRIANSVIATIHDQMKSGKINGVLANVDIFARDARSDYAMFGDAKKNESLWALAWISFPRPNKAHGGIVIVAHNSAYNFSSMAPTMGYLYAGTFIPPKQHMKIERVDGADFNSSTMDHGTLNSLVRRAMVVAINSPAE